MSALEIKIVADCDEKLVVQLAQLHSSAFPANMQLSNPIEYFMEGLREKGTINIILQSAQHGIVGHFLAYPQSWVFRELRKWDPAMEDNPKGLYLEIIQILPEQRRQGGATRLFGRMALEAKRRGFTSLSMHARKMNGMDEMIRKLFPESRFLRTVENWLGKGEPFEYIETPPRCNALNRRPTNEKELE